MDGPNLYQYARSNPCRMRDPSGTQAEDEESHRVPNAQPAQTLTRDRLAGPAAAAEPAPVDKPTGAADPPADGGRSATGAPGPRLDSGGPASGGDAWTTGRPATAAGTKTLLASSVSLSGGRGNAPARKRETTPEPPPGRPPTHLEIGRDKVPEGETPKWDSYPVDPWWTPIHTMTGVVMGLWQVPFPLVAAATLGWEVVEIAAPGFGDHEINANRPTDIGVAWVGWAVAAGISSWRTRAPFPHGFVGSHCTTDRRY